MRVLWSVTFCLLLFTSGAFAEPVVSGVTNAASFSRPGLPNSGIAQGGMATLFGTELGPQPYEDASLFPLPTELAGVSVKIHTAGSTVDAIPVRVSATQTTVIVPSATPVGSAEITLTFQGQTSAPVPIEIVAHAFGAFALNQAGSGPGIFTNAMNAAVNTIFSAASPGDYFDVWGVGLGAVPGLSAVDERRWPAPGDLRASYDVRVLVGGREAEVLYAGRSGCCAGLDQVRFVIPSNVVGCYVPVVVLVNGVASNTVTISVSEDGAMCSDQDGLSAEELNCAQEDGAIRLGRISLRREVMDVPVVGVQTMDQGTAKFQHFTAAELAVAQGDSSLYPAGSCIVYQYPMPEDRRAPLPEDLEVIRPRNLDAGNAINIHGPEGDRVIAKADDGSYSAPLSGAFLTPPQPPFLSAGSYTFENANGGADIASFNATETLPEPLEWTNQDEITTVNSGQDLVVTWTGGGVGSVTIHGTSSSQDANAGAGFVCQAEAAAGRFVVPSWAIDSLPPTSLEFGFPMGMLSLVSNTRPQRLSIDDLDAAFVEHSEATQKLMGYHLITPPNGGEEGPENPEIPETPATGFAISSSSFDDGGAIPQRHADTACGGDNLSPNITIHNGPPEAKSYVLLMDDPAYGMPHWGLWNIPAEVTAIPEGNPGHIGVNGTNGFGHVGYTGPCPPAGESHTYRVRIWALPLVAAVGAGADITALLDMLDQLNEFALGSAEYRGTFNL